MANDSPSGKVPTPPPLPPEGGARKGPPPRGLGKPAEIKKLAELKDSERAGWISSTQGLNIDKLKVAYFPEDAELLATLNVAAANAGKLIPEDPAQKDQVASLLRRKVREQLAELFQLADSDPQTVSAVFKQIDAKVKNWKMGAAGLNDCQQFLNTELPKLQSMAKKAQVAVDLSQDKDYQALQKKKQALDNEYQMLYQQYQRANTQKQSELFEQLDVVVKKIDAARDLIKSHKTALEDSKEKVRQIEKQIAAPEKAKQDAIANLQNKIRILENPSGYTDPDTQQENRKIIKQLRNEIKEIENLPTGSQEELDTNQAALQKARELVKKHEVNDAKAVLFKEMFSHPDTWKEVMRAERNKENQGGKHAKKHTFDTKGMYMGENNEKAPGDRQFDARFLDANQLSRLARFFSHHAGEYTISDTDSVYDLIKNINGVLGINEQLNFDILMDIAEGKIKRKPGIYADYIAMNFLDEASIDIDNSRKPNYDYLLMRAENFRNAELNKRRGITVRKSGKYFEHARSIDLSYLTDTQMEKLQTFFGTSNNDLRNEDGSIDKNAVNERINNLLNRTNLAFEDIIDVAEGHLVRKTPLAPNEHFTLLLNVERKGKAPDYDAAVQQRVDHIAEMERQRKAAQHAARLKDAADREQALAAVQEEATAFIEAAKEQFERPFKKRMADYALDVNDLEEFQLFADHVQVELSYGTSDILQEAVLARLKAINPNVQLGNSLKNAPSSGTGAGPGAGKEENIKVSLTKPKPELPHDETALRVVRNILSGIDVKTRYKKADVTKSFALANYKIFQNKDRVDQLKLLDKAITKAKANVLADPEKAFLILEGALTTVKEQLENEKKGGKRKLGDSRLEHVVNGLTKEVHAMKAALHQTSEQMSRVNQPKVGGG